MLFFYVRRHMCTLTSLLAIMEASACSNPCLEGSAVSTERLLLDVEAALLSSGAAGTAPPSLASAWQPGYANVIVNGEHRRDTLLASWLFLIC